jgi:hypothetical protein
MLLPVNRTVADEDCRAHRPTLDLSIVLTVADCRSATGTTATISLQLRDDRDRLTRPLVDYPLSLLAALIDAAC